MNTIQAAKTARRAYRHKRAVLFVLCEILFWGAGSALILHQHANHQKALGVHAGAGGKPPQPVVGGGGKAFVYMGGCGALVKELLIIGLVVKIKIVPNSSKNDLILEDEFIKIKATNANTHCFTINAFGPV